MRIGNLCISLSYILTLLHSERPKLYTIVVFLSAIGLTLKKVKVSHSLIAVGEVGVRVPLFLWHRKGTVVALLFYVHGKHLRSCRDGQLT